MRLFKIKLSALLIFLAFSTISAQNTIVEKEKIAKVLEDYFFLDRESIHLQFNKNTYLTNEDIWFSGYVFHRKKKLPFFSTTNLYAMLFDEEGNKISDQLLFSNSGSFSGKFNLKEEFKSGKYYIQVYTNWMNNFKEDESSIFEISVINASEKSILNTNKPDLSKVNVAFFPEGGNIIQEAENSVGIKITDCNGNPLPLSEIEIIDQNKTVQKVILDKFGFGKFQFKANTRPFVSFILNGEKIEKPFPKFEENGIAIEINNYAIKDKTIAKVRTNRNSIALLRTKKLFLLVHQDNSYNIFDITFNDDSLEQKLIFSNDNLFEGVNTIRIIDSENRQYAERYIFKYPKDFTNFDLKKSSKSKDSIHFDGTLNLSSTAISISVIPENAVQLNASPNIFSSFLIAPYIGNNKIDASYYFENVSKAKQYALDLYLLNQNSSKYKWSDIISTPPKSDYPFDFGIDVKGTVNQIITDRTKVKTRIYSLKADIDEQSDINEKNEFLFKNLILADSTSVNFSLIDEKNKAIPLNLYPQILNNKRRFIKPFYAPTKNCAVEEKINFDLPEFAAGSITINTVEISVKKDKLKQASLLENSGLRGHKVDERDNTDVLNYIRLAGFEVHNHIFENEIHVYARSVATFNGQKKSPLLYIDGMLQSDFDILANMRMNEIDEIYTNPSMTSAASILNQGIIKIYRRPENRNRKNPTRSFEIKNGFAKSEKFKLKDYSSTSDVGFQNFGQIGWLPLIRADFGEFSFKIPDLKQKKVKIKIEGFSSDGKLISEIKTVDLE